AGDAGKGWLVVYLAQRFAAAYGVDATGVAACAVAVFFGHLFPVFFRFKGGKGVSTAGGILLAIHPWLGLAAIATWIIVAFFFRYSSLAAIVSAVFAPLYAFFMSLLGFELGLMLPAVILISALLVWRHKTNILKLVAGKERRIGEKRESASVSPGASGGATPAKSQRGLTVNPSGSSRAASSAFNRKHPASGIIGPVAGQNASAG